MKTAVIYARYSSDRQTEQSIEGQVRVCMEYAERNDIVIVGTYIDRAMTGTNDNREQFQKMLKDSDKNLSGMFSPINSTAFRETSTRWRYTESI